MGTVRKDPAFGATENDFDARKHHKMLASMSPLLWFIHGSVGTGETFLAV